MPSLASPRAPPPHWHGNLPPHDVLVSLLRPLARLWGFPRPPAPSAKLQFELLVRHPQSSEEEIEEYGEGAGATGEDGAGVEGREGRKGGDGTRRDRRGREGEGRGGDVKRMPYFSYSLLKPLIQHV